MKADRPHPGFPLFAALILFLAGCDGTVPPSPSPEPLRISFISVTADTDEKGGTHDSSEIRSVDLGDYVREVLISDDGSDPWNGIDDFQWSQDGRKIAFITSPHVQGPGCFQNQIRLLSFDGDSPGKPVVKIVMNNRIEKLCWSPDGRHIIYRWAPDSAGANGTISRMDISMDINDGNPSDLTDNGSDNTDPCWSPVGDRIAFVSERNGDRDIWVMDADGSDQTNLTKGSGYNSSPRWSPDGGKIAFVSYRNGSCDVWIMNPDGGGQTRLTESEGNKFNPQWSPNGKKIAFVSMGDDNISNIWVMNTDADNPDPKQLATGIDRGSGFQWSPDGRMIAFVSHRNGAGDIWVMDADGSDQTNLTEGVGENYKPRWIPAGF